jgi:uncharacterized protein (TIGR03089 family)
MADTILTAFRRTTAADATRPVVTYYDDATGERTELSAATLDNWVAKTANLLTLGLGLGTGDQAGIGLPAHWQTAAVLLGCWTASLAIGPADQGEVAFVTADRVADARAADVLALALAPLGLPFRPGPPAGAADYVVEVRAHGDRYTGPPPAPTASALTDGTTHAELVERAAGRVAAGARVLIDADATPDPADWLIAPLVAGASIVLCRNLDPGKLDARLAAERAVSWT